MKRAKRRVVHKPNFRRWNNKMRRLQYGTLLVSKSLTELAAAWAAVSDALPRVVFVCSDDPEAPACQIHLVSK